LRFRSRQQQSARPPVKRASRMPFFVVASATTSACWPRGIHLEPILGFNPLCPGTPSRWRAIGRRTLDLPQLRGMLGIARADDRPWTTPDESHPIQAASNRFRTQTDAFLFPQQQSQKRRTSDLPPWMMPLLTTGSILGVGSVLQSAGLRRGTKSQAWKRQQTEAMGSAAITNGSALVTGYAGGNSVAPRLLSPHQRLPVAYWPESLSPLASSLPGGAVATWPPCQHSDVRIGDRPAWI
jgi:hypothetical protein